MARGGFPPPRRDSVSREVHIGGHTYRVKFVKGLADGGEPLSGLCMIDNTTIKIEADLNSQRGFQVFWHEILHAVVDQYSLGKGTEEERLVDNLAHATVQLLRDNPCLRTQTAFTKWKNRRK